MDLLVNDLSLHGQFPDINSFREAVGRVMAMRQTAARFGREVYCHRNVALANVTHASSVLEVAQRIPVAERRVLLSWLTRLGPFWEDLRSHSSDEYLESKGAVVTDTALGEAAFSRLHGFDRRVVSFTPSDWAFSPIPVTWVRDQGACLECSVINFIGDPELETALISAPQPLDSWEQLAGMSRLRFSHLYFAEDAFGSLRGHPFVLGAAHRILERLDVLDKLRQSVDETGRRTPEGEGLYMDHFVGDKAWFSDSSDDEKIRFAAELTFRHPEAAGQSLFCTWHGKVKSPQIRIHFSWPVPPNQELYVVYIGPKITKR